MRKELLFYDRVRLFNRNFGGLSMKIAVLSNVNIDGIINKLRKLLKDAEFYLPPFNTYAIEMLNKNSELYDFKPDSIFLYLDGYSLFDKYINDPFLYKDFSRIGSMEARKLMDIIENFMENMPNSVIILNTIVIPPKNVSTLLEFNTNYTPTLLEYSFNERISKLKIEKRISGLAICPWRNMVLTVGYDNIYDRRYWYLGRVPLNMSGLEMLAKCFVKTYETLKTKPKKVIVLDLDNTLWGGIVGEDGIDEIKLGEDGIGKAYRDFQKLLLAMKHRGVLLTIASKNNENDVKEVFDKHPMMVLKWNDFVVKKINWLQKSENIKSIAEELNLGIDSFVVIDDNPFERMEIKSAFPSIIAPEFPEDPAILPEWFIGVVEDYFSTTMITEEDKKRSDIYLAETKRKTLLKTAQSFENFLKQLEMVAIITINDELMIPRQAQLTQRTNQFNLTTRRYNEKDIERFIKDDKYIVYNLELIDKFGSNGIVGLIIVSLDDKQAFIDTFLMSCRIIGRRVEDAFMGFVLRDLKKKGIKKVFGEYIPTKKNKLVSDVYEKLGFELIETKEDGSKLYKIEVDENIKPMPEWVKVEVRKR